MLTGLESQILRIISENDGISRQQIAQKLKISKPIVSSVVSELINKKLVVESGTVMIQSGRPRVKLSFVRDSWYCVGLEIDENFLEIVISDLLGNILDSLEENISVRTDFGEIVEFSCKKIHEILSKNSISLNKLLGVGIGIAGMVDPKTGKVRTAPAFEVKDLDVASMFSQKLNTSTFVMNRVKAVAFTEYRIGVAKGLESAVFIFFDSGLGAALLLDGRIHTGYFGKAGELGWMVTDFSDSDQEIIQKMNFGHLARKISGHLLNEISKKSKTNIEEIFTQKQGLLEEFLEKGLKHLAAAVANMLLVFDPQAIIFKGRLGQRYFDRIMETVLPELRKLLPEQFYENLDIRKGKVEKFDVALGAAFMVRQKVMNM